MSHTGEAGLRYIRILRAFYLLHWVKWVEDMPRTGEAGLRYVMILRAFFLFNLVFRERRDTPQEVA